MARDDEDGRVRAGSVEEGLDPLPDLEVDGFDRLLELPGAAGSYPGWSGSKKCQNW